MKLHLLKPLGLAVGLLWLGCPPGAQSLTPGEAQAIAEDTYIDGCSLISVEMSRKVITNVEKRETAPSVLDGTWWPPAIAKAAG